MKFRPNAKQSHQCPSAFKHSSSFVNACRRLDASAAVRRAEQEQRRQRDQDQQQLHENEIQLMSEPGPEEWFDIWPSDQERRDMEINGGGPMIPLHDSWAAECLMMPARVPLRGRTCPLYCFPTSLYIYLSESLSAPCAARSLHRLMLREQPCKCSQFRKKSMCFQPEELQL